MGRDAIDEGMAGDPYAYVIPKKQWDEWEAKNLVNILHRGGLEIKKTSSDFMADGKHSHLESYLFDTNKYLAT
jgi:hypothetical protein